MASVDFDHVTKVFDDGTRAVDDLTLEVADGEFMVLVGPSGCGKTTALRMTAGLEEITEGEIRIGDDVVNDLDPQHRDIAMVFQNYALYPHKDVYNNIAFGLKMRRVPRAEIERRVNSIGRVLGLQDLLHRKPRQLSGGQRQRVAMGRAIVREPRVFLMDEPLSNLDARLRVQMRAEVARIQHELEATTIYVTHDQVEAMTMGDRVAVMRKGVLQQTDHPQRVYDAPANLFVASFIGSPPMNLVQARVDRADGALAARVGDQALTVSSSARGLEAYVGRTVGLGIRPEHLRDASAETGAPAERRLRGTVLLTEALGSEVLAHLEIPGEPVVTEEVLEVAGDVDPSVRYELEAEEREGRSVFVARLDMDARGRPDETLELVCDPRRLHFFDLETGLAIRDDDRQVS
jgi:multiple sugar transport system ATP-binding protein